MLNYEDKSKQKKYISMDDVCLISIQTVAGYPQCNVLRCPVLDVPVVEWLPAAAVTSLSVAVSSMSGRSLMSVPGHTL